MFWYGLGLGFSLFANIGFMVLIYGMHYRIEDYEKEIKQLKEK